MDDRVRARPAITPLWLSAGPSVIRAHQARSMSAQEEEDDDDDDDEEELEEEEEGSLGRVTAQELKLS